MPVAASGLDALDFLCEAMTKPNFANSVHAKPDDLAFLTEFFNGEVVQTLFEIESTLQRKRKEPVSCDNINQVVDVLDVLSGSKKKQATELAAILSSPHFRALIEAHDDIGAGNYDDSPDILPPLQTSFVTDTILPEKQDAIRMVGIRKNADEPLGITITKNLSGDLAIVRILAGGAVDNQGLLHVGDVIKEVNGQEVTDPDQLQNLMKKSGGSVTLKIIPSYLNENIASPVYLKAHYNYDPQRDNLIPCRDAGLTFKEGDILQVLAMDDPNWWQAKKVDDDSPSGLIPSQTLQEKRKAFVRPEFDYTHKSLLCGLMTKKKKKLIYQSSQNNVFDRSDLVIYEEVQRMPPFQRKCLVLVGPRGIGRRKLAQHLIDTDPKRFGAAIPHTSRSRRADEVDGEVFWFMLPDQMALEISENRFIEYGQYEGHEYGTKYTAIREVIRSARMCVLNLSPKGLKAIRTSEFMPYIVFIASPPVEILRNMHELARQRGKTGRVKTERDFRSTLEESKQIESSHKHYFDLMIVNDNMDETFKKLRTVIETLCTEPQWVPVNWVF